MIGNSVDGRELDPGEQYLVQPTVFGSVQGKLRLFHCLLMGAIEIQAQQAKSSKKKSVYFYEIFLYR